MEHILIDLSSIAHPLFHVTASDSNPNATSIATVAKVRALASGNPRVAVCCDSPKSFRKQIDPTYKGQRPESDATLVHQIKLVIETLTGDGFPCWTVDGYEADDLIATATAIALTDKEASVIICSADKDLLALVGPRVFVKSLKDGTILDADAVVAKFKVKPEQIPDYLALVGDASDNIIGAKGVGPVNAARLLAARPLDATLELLRSGGAAAAQLTGSLAQSLEEFSTRLPTVRKLIALRIDAPIPFDQIKGDRVPADIAEFGDETDQFNPERQPGDDIDEAMPTLQPAEPVAVPTAAGVPIIGLPTQTALAPAPQPARDTPTAPDSPSHDPAPASTQAPPMPRPGDMVRYEAPPTVAIVDYQHELEPRSMNQVIELSKHIHASRLFSAYGTPQAVMTTLLAGRELGFSAMASLRGFHIIEGKPTLAADTIRALVLKSGAAKYFRCTARSAELATFETQRGDDPPIALTYSIDEAKAAGAVKAGSGWARSPADMLVARASAKLARLVYPDVVHGLYSPEEFD